MRKMQIFVGFLLVNALVLGLLFAHAAYRQRADQPALRQMGRLVAAYQLTDLCLFTDARYARHPSMADRHTPFQDSPMSAEHFPSGTLILPPPHLRPR